MIRQQSGGKPVVCGLEENKGTPQHELQKKLCPQERGMVGTAVRFPCRLQGQRRSH